MLCIVCGDLIFRPNYYLKKNISLSENMNEMLFEILCVFVHFIQIMYVFLSSKLYISHTTFQCGCSLHIKYEYLVSDNTDPGTFDLLVYLIELQGVSHLCYRR